MGSLGQNRSMVPNCPMSSGTGSFYQEQRLETDEKVGDQSEMFGLSQ